MDCQHLKTKCTLNRTDDEYCRTDLCISCGTALVCNHFKVQKQPVRYGRDRYKPAAVVSVVDEFVNAELTEFDLVDL